MTITESTTTPYRLVADDLYRDIHKGIRSDLFSVTSFAGSLDPSNVDAKRELADRVRKSVYLLTEHANHEDRVVLPALELHLPALAERIVGDHHVIEARLDSLVEQADAAVRARGTDVPLRSHMLYLNLASFTSAYLEHQDVEERVLMPALDDAIGTEAVTAMHQAIVGAISPQDMAMSMALMLPAMNIDDRAQVLGGMQAHAPREVFQGVWGLATSVLTEADTKALAARLGLN
jgi:hypothetical protein